jgi:hypothetical protein
MSVHGFGSPTLRQPQPAGWHPAVRNLGVVLLLLAMIVPEAGAQDVLLEALLDQRQRVRTAEVLAEIGAHATPHGPVGVDAYLGYRQVSPHLPSLLMPRVALPAIAPRPAPQSPDAPPPVELSEIQWVRVAPGHEHDFMERFQESLWIGASGAVTPLDTMATPEIRARLQTAFGTPTRTPVARSGSQMQAGSEFVQFEYWFVVNDDIAFVVMDRDGPFGRGLVMIADEEHVDVVEALRQDLTRRLLAQKELMPYVDYYQTREDGQWHRTGYDGQRYYVIEMERPRWARRGQQRGRWYDFR